MSNFNHKKIKPTIERLHELLEYKKNGHLIWKLKGKGRRPGTRAGTKSHGYRKISVDYVQYMEHQVVFAINKGYWPKEIDHINQTKDDNRIENLRECTRAQNNANQKLKGGTSKFKGVTKPKHTKKWMARIKVNKKDTYLGYFTNEIDAAKAYNVAAKELHGEFAYLNKTD